MKIEFYLALIPTKLLGTVVADDVPMVGDVVTIEGQPRQMYVKQDSTPPRQFAVKGGVMTCKIFLTQV
jgi:hypothetical protein